ncbi:acyl-coenzyme A thioesterase 1-like [Diadema antillarum]|uniref:acyl-coenzyme A thioesterase 1-like n=1 Tax=Diadema antillarum TaxID=105358 RepID=UPI003A881BD1
MYRLQCLLRHTTAHHSCSLQACTATDPTVMPSGQPTADMSTHPAIHVTPQSGLADGLLDIRAAGLHPGQPVTIQAEVRTECQRFVFQSSAIFKADSQGEVAVARQPSLGGTYEGIEPMGLIWSCKPVPAVAHLYPRVKKTDSRLPLRYTLRLVDHESPGQEELALVVMERRYLADHVERHEFTEGKAHGVFFLPKQRGSSDPLPVVIELRGIGNGVLEDRASLLASHGYAVFALDFLKSVVVGEMPDTYYFDSQAILDLFEYISQHSRLDEKRVGMFGYCTGSTLVIHIAARLNLPIRCLVFTSLLEAFSCVLGMRLPDGRLIHPIGTVQDFVEVYEKDGYRWCRTYPLEDVPLDLEAENVVNDCIAPVENISVPVLLLVSGDDQYATSKNRMRLVRERMIAAGKGHLVQSHLMEGMGHLVDAPYMPIVTQSSVRFPSEPKPSFTTWGGTTKPYAHSIEKSWHLMLDYFKEHLQPTELYR